MGNKLSWTNNNTQPTNVEIYRGLAPLDTANLTDPLVTLTNGESSWEDNGVIYGATYYYVVQLLTKDGLKKVPSRNISMQAGLGRGLGPNILLQGNERLGYFGLVEAADFIPPATILAAQNGGAMAYMLAVRWHKFIRRGKILYVPQTVPASGNYHHNIIYQAGFMYGTDDTGPVDGRLGTPVNQRRVINWRGEKYTIRLPRGYADPDSPTQVDLSTVATLNHETLSDSPGCEYNDLIYPLMVSTPTKQNLMNVDFLTTANFISVTGRMVMCQEVSVASGNALWRHNQGLGTDRERMAAMTVRATGTASSSSNWYPIIELIEE